MSQRNKSLFAILKYAFYACNYSSSNIISISLCFFLILSYIRQKKRFYKYTNICHEDTVKRCSYDDKALRNDRKSSSFKSRRSCCELLNVAEAS